LLSETEQVEEEAEVDPELDYVDHHQELNQFANTVGQPLSGQQL